MSLDIRKVPSRKQVAVAQSVGGYINTGIAMVQGFLLIPLYLHYIGTHTYGLWLASGGIIGMLTLMNFGISAMIIQRVSRSYGEQNLERVGVYFCNGMVVYIFICLLFLGVGWGVSIWVPLILKVSGDDAVLLRHCFQIAVIGMTIGIFNECLRSFSLALLRPVIPMAGMAVGRIIGIVVTVWMLFGEFGLWAIPVGMLVAEGIIFIVNIVNAISLFRLLATKIHMDYKIIKEYARVSPALMMATAGSTLSQHSEPLLITMFLSPDVTTAYMITRKAADIVFLLLSQIVGTSMGVFAHLVGEGNVENIKKIASLLFNLVFASGLIGFAVYSGLNSDFIALWVGEQFALNQYVITLISMAFFVRILHNILHQLLNATGDFIYTSMVILLEGIMHVGLMVVIFQFMGVIGAPCALLITSSTALIAFIMRGNHSTLFSIKIISISKATVSTLVLFSMGLLFTLSIGNSQSWFIFILSLGGILLITTLLFGLINWHLCRDFFKLKTA